MTSTQQALHFLAEASAVVAESLDYEETLQRIAHSAVPAFAEIVVVHLVDREGELQRQVVATPDAARAQAIEEMWTRYRTADIPLRQVLETGDAWIAGPLDDAALGNIDDPEQRKLAAAIGIRWLIAAAMRRGSRAATSRKPEAILDVNAAAVERAFRDCGVGRMIHGHTHRPARHALVVDGTPRERIVLADWDDRGHYISVDATGVEAREIRG